MCQEKVVGPSDVVKANKVQGDSGVQNASTSSKRLGKIISRVASLTAKDVSYLVKVSSAEDSRTKPPRGF
jgi:hypothetical protein